MELEYGCWWNKIDEGRRNKMEMKVKQRCLNDKDNSGEILSVGMKESIYMKTPNK